MHQLRLFCRVAFICNLCWVATLFMRYYKVLPDGELKSTVIVAGIFLSIACNLIVNAWAGLLLLNKKPVSSAVPAWLLLFNLLCFIIQIYLLLK